MGARGLWEMLITLDSLRIAPCFGERLDTCVLLVFQ